jgi:DNA repair exonuclease SbcCD nuclease subunit
MTTFFSFRRATLNYVKTKRSGQLIIFALPFCLLPLLIYACNSAEPRPLKVGVIGDQTGSDDLEKSYEVLARGVEILNKEGVACALHTGDLLESRVSPEQYRIQFEQAVRVLDKLQAPWHLAPGDHDVNPPERVPNSSDRSREQLFRELYGKREPLLTQTLSHSFDVDGYHFIALNSQEHLHADPRWGDVFLARLTTEQIAWLESDLNTHDTAKGIVVFLHQPLWYNWSGWMAVHQLLRRHPVRAVIAGHFHYDQDEGTLDGIRYCVVGAAGANVKQASRDAGRVHHVTVIALDGDKVSIRLIPIDGTEPLSATSRLDMDRIQAIDTLLSEMSRSGLGNAPCLKGNHLYGPDAQPARISLTQIGNPIDLPVRINVQLLGDKLAFSSPGFLAGDCQQVISDEQCIMAPGTRVALSNTSSVAMNNWFGPLRPLWESGLNVNQGDRISIGDAVQVKVRLSFEGEQGEQYVEGLATTTISACSQ